MSDIKVHNVYGVQKSKLELSSMRYPCQHKSAGPSFGMSLEEATYRLGLEGHEHVFGDWELGERGDGVQICRCMSETCKEYLLKFITNDHCEHEWSIQEDKRNKVVSSHRAFVKCMKPGCNSWMSIDEKTLAFERQKATISQFAQESSIRKLIFDKRIK